jgi:hypothetical protein
MVDQQKLKRLHLEEIIDQINIENYWNILPAIPLKQSHMAVEFIFAK